ncbi:MaoC family dehydratase N-terminal domain-containing protein [Chloroflexota bacterium]
MAEETLITDEVREAIGKEIDSVVVEVEKGAIRRIAQAVGDPNPLWQDEEYAKKSRYGGIIASPTYIASIRTGEGIAALPPVPLKRVLNGGNELEFFHPIRPGDILTSRRILADVRQNESSKGKMVVMVLETTYTNQKGEVVAKNRQSIIRY